jgi:hypothetical protein
MDSPKARKKYTPRSGKIYLFMVLAITDRHYEVLKNKCFVAEIVCTKLV